MILNTSDIDLVMLDELKILPEMLESCVKKYINDFIWDIDIKSIGNGSYTYKITKTPRYMDYSEIKK